MNFPSQRWQIAPVKTEKVAALVESTGLSPLIAQVVLNRGFETLEEAIAYIEPESQLLPSPLEEFANLGKAVELLKNAIATEEKIAICGDYDADGMTSTALLLRALWHLGAKADYTIPSRMKDGYGINKRIVEEFASEGVGLILTVDNGISAYSPIALAIELGMEVIITDHHDLPEKLPPADAILNPKLLPETSPYRGLAGVGVAYILAVATAQNLGKLKGLTEQLLELFTLGTIADLVPLVGVNRRWLKRGLQLLPQSKLAGVQALIQVSGVKDEQKQLKPDDIGFKLGPRINAVGRIEDPQIVIELLTTDEPEVATVRAVQCEKINRERQELCQKIESEAIAFIEETPIKWKEARVLVLIKANWHHGVIGIVASRLVERYGVPVFIGTYEENDSTKIRGSARGIEEFDVFKALEFCHDILEKYGGHKKAGGFSLAAKNLAEFQEQLRIFAHQLLEEKHLKPLVKIDGIAKFQELNFNLYQQIESLQPWGIENDFPIFWTPNVRILEQKILKGNHLKLILTDNSKEMKAIAWRWADFSPLPSPLDIAYKLQENDWNGNKTIELKLVGIRPTEGGAVIKKAKFEYQGRLYNCSLWEDIKELRIKNDQGKVLVVTKGQKIGLLGTSRENAQKVDVTQPHYFQLIKTALAALEAKNTT
ncbi:MAG: single-stranded-DNA-specific exonuclease RecJ [Gomphosphaeria aponina SAG 52.96 = DSM 107014]|uniref:Single-stranded-DNA-specific exonuclease RecJ n=1 Tax=Gomphosphaeria aponina SAG 52.96 = DSM 107014 TaxID=1521640 RepID=A0A941JM69_9CHRO|nr:single-stranded-DNA-specific exonuclease RecJ [Gomphosphaeria aponina SAG 52.96 = DSM 107014]